MVIINESKFYNFDVKLANLFFDPEFSYNSVQAWISLKPFSDEMEYILLNSALRILLVWISMQKWLW